MFSPWILAIVSLALNVVEVAATGGFPPVTGPPGACGLLPTDASCSAVFISCVNSLQKGESPYSKEVCVAAASCYPMNPDAFLNNLYCRISGPGSNQIQSVSIPRLSDAIVSNIFDGNPTIHYNRFAAWYEGVVKGADTSVAMLIDPAFVKMSYDTILAWTGFCSMGSIPKKNFVDWFQYFSTVKGPAETCNTAANCPLEANPHVIDLTVTCAKDRLSISNPFSVNSCVAAALNWEKGVDSFLQAVTCRYNLHFHALHPVPVSNRLPSLSFSLPVRNPPPYSYQDFIDFTYNTLFSIKTKAVRYPLTVGFLNNRWRGILAWTNSCKTGAVPVKNLSDLLKYSHIALHTSCPGA